MRGQGFRGRKCLDTAKEVRLVFSLEPKVIELIVLGFNDTSTLVGHFVSSLRERENRDKRNSRGDERER